MRTRKATIWMSKENRYEHWHKRYIRSLRKTLKQLPLSASVMNPPEATKNLGMPAKEVKISRKWTEKSIRNKNHDNRNERLIDGFRDREVNLWTWGLALQTASTGPTHSYPEMVPQSGLQWNKQPFLDLANIPAFCVHSQNGAPMAAGSSHGWLLRPGYKRLRCIVYHPSRPGLLVLPSSLSSYPAYPAPIQRFLPI